MPDIESSNNVVEPVVNVEPQEATNPVESEIVQSETTESNIEEVAKPQQSKDDNAKFAAIRREAEKKARDQMISEMYGESHGIHTYTEYQKAVEKEKQRKLAEEKGYDYDSLEEIINQDPRIKQANELLTKKEQEEKKQQEMVDFLDYYQSTFGKPYENEPIPKEVFDLQESGVPFKVAFKAFGETDMLKKKVAELEAKLTNDKNASTSTGKIGQVANVDSDFISKEVFDTNKSNQRWVMNNLEKITKSRPKW